MDYSFPDNYMWDFWLLHWQGKTHLFGLQASKGHSEENGRIYHAYSEDLIDWTSCGYILKPGKSGDIDEKELWTGCTVHHCGKFYLYYTGRRSKENHVLNLNHTYMFDDYQTICLALSEDLEYWCKYEGNPVIRADKKWYTEGDCRDLSIIKDPASDFYYGFFATSLLGGIGGEKGVIGLCRSDDLLNWEIMPPAFNSQKYPMLDVPDVFFLNGRYYMLLLTGSAYGRRDIYSESSLISGINYVVSDRIEGPYYELEDNVLLGSIENRHTAVARSIIVDGKAYLLYVQCEWKNGKTIYMGKLSTPKLLDTDANGFLRAKYHSGIEKRVTGTLFKSEGYAVKKGKTMYNWGNWDSDGIKVTGSYNTGWSVHTFDIHVTEGFIFSLKANMVSGRAMGIVFRYDNGGYAVILDFEKEELLFTSLSTFHPTDRRKIHFNANQQYHIRVVSREEFNEVYIDEILWLQMTRDSQTNGFFGLYVENGRAIFEDIEILSLDTSTV